MFITQKMFEKTVARFSGLEDARDLLWRRAQNLLKKNFEIEAHILILATWNYAGFRYVLKRFDIKKFEQILKAVEPIFKKLGNLTFQKANFDDPELKADVSHIFSQLNKITKQTGATKIMALKKPGLFVMWDTSIRKKYRIHDNGRKSKDHIDFLKTMKENFGHITWKGKEPLAKAIDEFNYVKFR